MMKTSIIIYLLVSLLVIFFSCNNEKSSAEKSHPEKSAESAKTKLKKKEKKELEIVFSEDKAYLEAYYELPHIKKFYQWQGLKYINPRELSIPEDLTKLQYDELRLLRNEVFARNGYLFEDGFLRGYFNRFKWYLPIFKVDSFKVKLNQMERNLINDILEEEKARKDRRVVDKKGLQLYNSQLVVNYKQFSNISDTLLRDLEERNFSILDANRGMPFYIYDKNAYQYIPHYITIDLYLFIMHKYFARFLEKLEEKTMFPLLAEFVQKLSLKTDKYRNQKGAKIESAAEWARVYCSLIQAALGEEILSVPQRYRTVFDREKEQIEKEIGAPLFIKNQLLWYNDLKPRGHYTKSDSLKKYFKALRWVTKNGIHLDNEQQLRGMILMAYVIKNDIGLRKRYNEYIGIIEKIAGREDNLSLSDLMQYLEIGNMSDALSDNNLSHIRDELKSLKKEKIKAKFGESYNPEEAKIKRLYLFSSTYSISGEIFSKLIHIDERDSKRPFPKGLDIPAIFGNKQAEKILMEEYGEAKDWSGFKPKFKKLQNQFNSFNDWNHNYGFKGLETALNASSEDARYPDYMKTDYYNRKELSTTLASWAHIKHDLILYQEKPFAAEAGQGGGPKPPKHYSYVEPNLKFWDSSIELVKWLEELAVHQDIFMDELKRIKKLGLLLKQTAHDQVDGKKISDDAYNELHYVGGKIEYILLGLLQTDHLPEREKSMAIVADVYEYNGTNLNVGIGHADDIFVVVPMQGEFYLARGSVFSYYEFKGGTLTDEQWKQKIISNDEPARPKWLQPVIRYIEKPNGVMQFR